MSQFANFVTPSLGRLSLMDTLDSIQCQSGNNYASIVVFDNRAESKDGFRRTFRSPMFNFFESSQSGSAGRLRNEGVTFCSSEWVCFVDDDDILGPHYIDHLAKHAYEQPKADVIIFRMDDPNLGVLPDPDNPQIAWSKVGMSYAVKRPWFDHVRFIDENRGQPGPRGNEDIALLLDLQEKGAEFFISPHVDYIVRPNQQRNWKPF